MVDRDSVVARLARLGELLAQLDVAHRRGIDVYLENEDLRAATERRLQLAIQVVIDVGAHLAGELNARPPEDYGDIFRSLADARQLDRGLAQRLVRAAGQRNLLVHAYTALDEHRVFESLEHLDDLRAFAAAAQRIVDATP